MRPSLLVAAGLTLVATAYAWFTDSTKPTAVVEPIVRTRDPKRVGVQATPSKEGEASNYLIDREPWTEATADPFVPKQPPPPPPVAYIAPPPPRPVAPQFPFQYFGRVTAPDGTRSTFLSKDSRMIPIKVNEILEGSYKVESMTDSQIVVVYTPLGEKTVINLPSTAP